MSKYHKAFQGFVKVFTGAKQPGVKGSSTTIIGTKPNVGNLKKNQETLNKLKKITDTYVTKAGKVDPGLKKALRDSGSKSLQKTEKILRKNKKDGGRMGLKGGGSDMGSTTNKSINSLRRIRENRKKSKISELANSRRDRSPMERQRVLDTMKSKAKAMGGNIRTAGEMSPLKGESMKSFKQRTEAKVGGRMGLKKGGGSDLGMQSVKHGIDKNPNITAADPKAKFIAKAKNKKSKKKFI